MMHETLQSQFRGVLSRRTFLGGSLAASGALSALGLRGAEPGPSPGDEKPASLPKITKKFKLGVVGCGSRGTFVTKLFQEHGGFEIYAAADYFAEAADKFGDTYGVDKNRRFAGLSGYKRVIESGVDNLTEGHFENPSVARSVDSNLTAILVREAGYRQGRLTMEELLKENKKLEFDFAGFKV